MLSLIILHEWVGGVLLRLPFSGVGLKGNQGETHSFGGFHTRYTRTIPARAQGTLPKKVDDWDAQRRRRPWRTVSLEPCPHPTVDGCEIHFAPPQTLVSDDSPVNTNKRYGFNHGFLSWCEMDFATIHPTSESSVL